jgi:DNA-binding FadR family transcriptional regulator
MLASTFAHANTRIIHAPASGRTRAGMVQKSKHRHKPLDADRLFHVRIAVASGNGALVLVVQTLWDQRRGPLYRSLERKLEYPKKAAETMREHLAIVSAIVRRAAAAHGRDAQVLHLGMEHR